MLPEIHVPTLTLATPGMLGRFDFGVKLARLDVPAKRIDLKLAELYFGRDSVELSAQYLPLLTELADRIRRGEKAKVTVKVAPPSPEGCTPACQLGRRRIDAVKAGTDVSVCGNCKLRGLIRKTKPRPMAG